MISIIIPTLNEENYLPKLLECIKKQTYKDYEIIISDYNSKDKTRQIAKKFKCKIVQGGSPAEGRNHGAEVAKGDILFFIDADCIIKKEFLYKALNQIKKRNLDVTGCYLWPLSERVFDNTVFALFNFWIFLSQFFYAGAAAGAGIFCKRSLHQKINGFDEKLKLSEDMDYARRASKYGKFRILNKVKTYTSVRRFDREGRLKLAIKIFSAGVHRVFLGEIKTDVFKYRLEYKK